MLVMALSLAEPVANVEASKSPDWASVEAAGAEGAEAEELDGCAKADTGWEAAEGWVLAWVGCGVDDWVEVAAGAGVGVTFFVGGF